MTANGRLTIKPAIYIDSCLIIELVKAKRNVELIDSRMNEAWFVERLLEAAKADELRLVTSTIALVECIKSDENYPEPIEDETKQLISDFLWSGVYIELIAFDPFVAERARDLRWEDNLKIKNQDAIHVATALLEKCSEFLTLDEKLRKQFAPLEPTMRGAGLIATVPSKTAHLAEERRSAPLI